MFRAQVDEVKKQVDALLSKITEWTKEHESADPKSTLSYRVEDVERVVSRLENTVASMIKHVKKEKAERVRRGWGCGN